MCLSKYSRIADTVEKQAAMRLQIIKSNKATIYNDQTKINNYKNQKNCVSTVFLKNMLFSKLDKSNDLTEARFR